MILTLALANISKAQQWPLPPPSSDEALQAVRFDQLLGATVPKDDIFRDETGQSVQLGDCMHDQPVILSLVYYRCPMLCTLVLNNAVESFKQMTMTPGQDFQVIFVSISPKEAPELARAKKESYLQQFGKPETAGGWHFLTGTETNIRKLADAIGYHYGYDSRTDQFAHPSGLVVLTPEGRVSRYFYGVTYDPQSLRLSLIQAGGGGIGARVLQVLLRCYEFDPATGKYTLVVMRLMRVLGVLTVAMLAGGIGAMIWLEKRRARVQRALRAATGGSP